MKYFSIVIIYAFFVSCSAIEEPEYHAVNVNRTYNVGLHKAEKVLRFDVGKKFVNRSICLIPYLDADSTEYLFYLNGYGNDIYVFDVDSSRLVDTIELDRDGPNGVGWVRGFEVLNLDSIYLTSAFRRRLFLVNRSGEILSTVDYSKYRQGYPVEAGLSSTFENMRMGFEGDIIYLPFYPGYDEGNYKSISPEDIRFVAALNVKEKVAKVVDVGFPHDYWKTNFYPSWFGFFYDKGRFFINFMFDNRILVSQDAKSWKSYNISSKYADVKKYLRREQGAGARYMSLVPDPYRNVYYRFVAHQQFNIEDRTHKDLILYPQHFSIIILDEDLNIIGETNFPKDLYDMHGYFISKEGLYISLSNPFSKGYDVDKLSFQLFKLKENEE